MLGAGARTKGSKNQGQPLPRNSGILRHKCQSETKEEKKQPAFQQRFLTIPVKPSLQREGKPRAHTNGRTQL